METPTSKLWELWYSHVRRLSEQSENRRETSWFCFNVYNAIKGMNFKDKDKFIKREGPDFEELMDRIRRCERYPEEVINTVIFDDEYWNTMMPFVLH